YAHRLDGGERIERHRAVMINDRHPVDRAEAPVDFTDQLLDALLHALVILNADARGHDDHQKNDAAVPFRRPLEHRLEALEPVEDAFGVILPVDGQDDLVLAERFLDLVFFLPALGAAGGAVEFFKIDAHRKRAHAHQAAADADVADAMLQADHAL